MENRNNNMPGAVLYALRKMLKRLLPQRESVVPVDKAEMMKLKPENIADDGSAVCKETGAFIVPEGWNEGSIEMD